MVAEKGDKGFVEETPEEHVEKHGEEVQKLWEEIEEREKEAAGEELALKEREEGESEEE